MASAVTLAFAAGVAGLVGFGVARGVHFAQAPKPVPSVFAPETPSAVQAPSQLAAVLGGPVFRDIALPSKPATATVLPSLPASGAFAFDVLTLRQVKAADTANAKIPAESRHRLEGRYRHEGQGFVVTVEHCDGAAVVPPVVVDWKPTDQAKDSLGRVVDAAMRAVLQLEVALKPAPAQDANGESPRVLATFPNGVQALIPASVIRNGRYSVSTRDGIDELLWLPAANEWQSRVLISTADLIHAARVRVRATVPSS